MIEADEIKLDRWTVAFKFELERRDDMRLELANRTNTVDTNEESSQVLVNFCLYLAIDYLFVFLSATEYFPSRTIIQPGWVSSSSSLSLLSLSLLTFLQWDNLRTL